MELNGYMNHTFRMQFISMNNFLQTFFLILIQTFVSKERSIKKKEKLNIMSSTRLLKQ